MKEGYKQVEVVSNNQIARDIFEMKIATNFDNTSIIPGQFYMLRNWEYDPLLSRPFSVCEVEKDILTFLYKVVGRGTDILSKIKPTDNLNILGPLGNGFNLNIRGKVAVVSGGIGIAPLVYLVKRLKTNIDFYAGFQDEVYYLDKIKDYVENLYVSTEDGSEGEKGFIIDILEIERYDTVFTCGPTVMMKKIVEMGNDKTNIFVSMENIMACGIGSCLGCSIKTTNGMKRVCKEGPVFDGKEVIFSE